MDNLDSTRALMDFLRGQNFWFSATNFFCSLPNFDFECCLFSHAWIFRFLHFQIFHPVQLKRFLMQFSVFCDTFMVRGSRPPDNLHGQLRPPPVVFQQNRQNSCRFLYIFSRIKRLKMAKVRANNNIQSHFYRSLLLGLVDILAFGGPI